MQGHGYAQPVKQPPHPAGLVFLRVLFVGLAFVSMGFLSWAMMLRLAVVTRRGLDRGLLVAVLAADVLSVVLLGSEPGDEIHTPGGYLGLTVLLFTLVASTAYYLVADIRHFQRLQEAHDGPRTPGYGYGQPPFTGTTVPIVPHPAMPQPRMPHTPAPHTPVPHAPAPHTPVPHAPAPHTPAPHTPVPPAPAAGPPGPRPPIPAPPARPAPARIDQVRAELDELSDYLRRHDGQPTDGNGGDREGGR
ncbi:hypothetical protein [Streptomyces sp. NPDC102462]|uniref:hypothetical protein n=1 Tax=Streptomyces sp. NPDC102462 TaxID=3366178 RepID=UPI003829AFC3